jgi:hypothetical protein
MSTLLESGLSSRTRVAQPVVTFEQAKQLTEVHGTPLLAMSRSVLARNYEAMRNALPNVELFYAAKANLAYVAPAVGPLDDVGTIGMDLVEQVIRIYDNFGYQTQIVVAEAKYPIHVLDAAVMGADVAVLPGAVIEQLFRHPLSAQQFGKPRPS